MIDDINITIGSDPEFVIMCGDNVKNALEIFTRLQEPDYCCECPHPSDEDIKNIYDYGGMEKTFVSDAMRHLSTYYLAPLYPFTKVTAIMQFYEQYNYNLVDVYEGVKQEHLKKSAKVIKDITDENYIGIQQQRLGNKFEDLSVEIQIVIIKRFIRRILDIKNWYDVLEVEEQKKYDDILQDEIIEFYEETLYPELIKLPDKIQENVIKKIINDYKTDCSSCEMEKSYFCSTELGCDGQSVLGEIRPKPGNNPVEHFNEILKLMEELNDMLAPEIICYGDEQLQVKAGSIQGDYTLGGHIHLGYKKFIIESDIKSPISKSDYISKHLSNFLSVYVGIPLILIEHINEAIKRRKFYGEFNAYNITEYGVEFRMPSSWLVSPLITIGALSLVYVVANDYIKVMLSDSDKYRNEEYYKKILMFSNLYNEFIYLDNMFVDFKEEIPGIYLEVQQMELYPEYKEYIDYIFDIIEQNETWESDENILPKWAELW